MLAATSFGPHGTSKTVRSGAQGTLTITSVSHRLFDAVRLDHPIARAVVQLLQARQAKGADGGLLTVIIASSLVLGASRRRIPVRICTWLLPVVLLNCVQRVVHNAAVPLSLSDLPSLLALVRTVLAPKHIALPGGEDVEHLALLIVTAFVECVPI